MKRITWFAALMLLLTPVLQAERPQHAKKNQSGTQQQVVSRPTQAQPKLKAPPHSMNQMKRITDERRWLEWTQKEAAKAATLRKNAPAHRNDTLAQARMLGKRIPYLEAPVSVTRGNARTASRAAAASALINGKSADTIFLGDHIMLSGTFANGYVSAVLRVYYDVDHDGTLSSVDPLVSSNILILDNDEYDTDPANGSFRVSLDNLMFGLVGSYLLSVDDFQVVSTALLVVRQQPAPAVVHITTQPAMEMLVLQVSGGSTFPRLFITDSAGTADVIVDKISNPWLTIYQSDYFGIAGLYVPPTSQSISVGSDTTPCVLTYSLAPYTVQGFYRDDHGLPIPGAIVESYGGIYTVRTKTDSLGSFIVGATSGYWYLYGNPPANEWMVLSRSTTVVVGQSSLTGVILDGVRANSSISGSVRFSGSGVGGVYLYTSCNDMYNRTLTGPDGSYSLPVWKPPTDSLQYYVSVSLGSALYYVNEPLPVYAWTGTTNLDFTLSKATGGIQGFVLDAQTTRPVAGAALSFSGTMYASSVTNDSGWYRVGLRDGYYYVYASAPGYFTYSSPMNVYVSGSFVTNSFFMRPSGVISGTVRDKSGIPIPYANVSAHDSTYWYYGYATAGPTGEYTMSNLTTGSYVVAAYSQGYLMMYYDNVEDPGKATFVSVTEGAVTPNIDFVLPRGGSIEGRITDHSGTPLAWASVLVYDTTFYSRSSASSNDSGYFSAGGLPTGDYYVNVTLYPYASTWYDNAPTIATATKVHVVAEQSTSHIDFILYKGASITGRVRNYQGNPIPYQYVYTVDTAGNWYQGTSTNDTGWYQLNGLVQGVYKVTAQGGWQPQWYDHKNSFETADTLHLQIEEVRSGIDFDLHALPGIYGTVTDSTSGNPIASVTVRALGDNLYSYSSWTDYFGSYGFALDPGRYSLLVTYEDATHASRFYYASEGRPAVRRMADRIDITQGGDPFTLDIALPRDRKAVSVLGSNLGMTTTNRGLFSNTGDVTKPSCRWPKTGGKDYLFESDFWAGCNWAYGDRLFGDFYGLSTDGRWHAATNFEDVGASDHQGVSTAYYNDNYGLIWALVVRQEMDAWPNTDAVLCRQWIQYDAIGAAPPVNDLYAAWFADFDVSDYGQNDLVGFDTANSLIYMYDGTGVDSTYVGVCLLGDKPARLRWWSVWDDTSFASESRRYNLLKTEPSMSLPTQSGDYRILVSTGPWNLNAGNATRVAAAYVAGKGRLGVINAARDAIHLYDSLSTGVDGGGVVAIPKEFALEQNYPNPFNPATVVRYQVPAASQVTLTVYDVLGREVTMLVNERKMPGTYTVPFNATSLASGVYFYTLRTESFVQTRKMLLLK